MSEPLSETETRAWRAFLVLWRVGLPSMDRTFRKQGLNHLEFGILATLGEQSRGSMSPSELADLAGISSSRLSHRLRVMEERGDVERRAAGNDGRMVEVRVTRSGRRKVAAAIDEHRADIRRLMFEPLDETQAEALADALMAIASRLTDHRFLMDYGEGSSASRPE